MVRSYQTLRAQIKDGDVLLFPRKKTFISNLISRVTGSRHVHVALAKWDGKRLKTREFREFKGYDERFVSELGAFDHVPTKFAWGDETEAFIQTTKDKPYSYLDAVIAVLPMPFIGRGYICSEFVARVLEGQINVPANPTPADLSDWFWENDYKITKVKNQPFDTANLVHLFGKKPSDIKLLEGPEMRKFKELTEFVKPEREVIEVFVHCSASDNPKHDNPETIDQWHRQRGWSEIGYHIYIDKLGREWECRNLEKTPAAQKYFNRKRIAICVGGLEDFTMAQFQTLKRRCDSIDAAYGGEMVFRGHREVSPKTCPVFNYKAVLRLDKNGRVKDGVPTVQKLEASNSEHMKAAKKQQDNGDVAVTVGGGALVTGAVELAKEPDALNTLKELTTKGLEYKSLFKTASELLSWVATWEGLMMMGGGCLAIWGWRMWEASKLLKEMRLKEEPKIRRLEREALAENS